MKDSLKFVSAIVLTLLLAFSASLLLEIDLVASHWSRQFLVILLMAIILVLGGLAVFEIGKSFKTK